VDAGVLSSLGVEPVKVTESPEAYRIRLTSNRQSLAILEELSREYSIHPRIRGIASELLKKCPEKDYDCYISRIAEFVRRNVKYVNDPPRREIFQSPIRTLEYGLGDCDDFAVLTASLLRAVGLNTRIKIKRVNDRWGHVVVEVLNPTRGWLEVDTTQKEEVMELGRLLKIAVRCRPLYRHPCSPLICEDGTVRPSQKPYCRKPLEVKKTVKFKPRIKHVKHKCVNTSRCFSPSYHQHPGAISKQNSRLISREAHGSRANIRKSSHPHHLRRVQTVNSASRGAHENSFPWWALIAGGAVVYALW